MNEALASVRSVPTVPDKRYRSQSLHAITRPMRAKRSGSCSRIQASSADGAETCGT